MEDEDAGSIFKDAGGRSEQEGLMTIGEKPSVREEIRMAIEDIYEEVQSIAVCQSNHRCRSRKNRSEPEQQRQER